MKLLPIKDPQIKKLLGDAKIEKETFDATTHIDFPIEPAVETALRLYQCKPNYIYQLPDNIIAGCENNHHSLGSFIQGDRRIFTEGIGKQASGKLKATHFFTCYSWPPQGNKTTIHPVCAFCASLVEEQWAEAEAESKAS